MALAAAAVVTASGRPEVRPQAMALAGLVVCLVVPSLDQVFKYTGVAGVIAYAIMAVLGVMRLPRLRLRSTERQAAGLLVLTLVVVVIVFVVAFPLANSGRFGPGSDTDEAYDLGVRALLEGRYPYAERTYLGNALHHLPGGLILSAPFVLLGSSAYQNLFWLAVFAFVARREFGDSREALLMLWVLLLSPVVLQQVVTGADGVANTVAVVASMWWVVRAEGTASSAGAVMLFALALCNRANFLLALPAAFALVHHRRGPMAALRVTGLAAALVVLTTAPFYIHDPLGFTPLEALNRVMRFRAVTPYADVMLVGAAVATAAATARRVTTFMAACGSLAAAQAILVIGGLLLAILKAQGLALSYSAYGTFFLFPGILACWSAARPMPWSGRRESALLQ